jgi:hypothetical protein
MIGVMTQPGRSVVPEVWEGTLAGRLPYIAFGAGPPLIVFRGLGFSNTNPTGFQRCLDPEVRLRPPGLGVGTTTTADLATDHARGLEAEFGKPVDILGISKEVLFAYTEAL